MISLGALIILVLLTLPVLADGVLHQGRWTYFVGNHTDTHQECLRLFNDTLIGRLYITHLTTDGHGLTFDIYTSIIRL